MTGTCCHVAGLRSGRYCSRQGRMPRSSTRSKSAADGRLPGCCCPSPLPKARLRPAGGALCWPWPPAPCMPGCREVPELFLFRPLEIGPEPPAVRKGPYMASNALHSTVAPILHADPSGCKLLRAVSSRLQVGRFVSVTWKLCARVDVSVRLTLMRLLHPERWVSCAPLADVARACGGLQCSAPASARPALDSLRTWPAWPPSALPTQQNSFVSGCYTVPNV